jgi:hypothetical protein
MASDSRATAYAEQLDALTRSAEALTPEARRRIDKLLRDANREILADVARSEPGSYNAARLNALKAQVDRVMEDFARQAASEVSDLEQSAYDKAGLSVNATVAAGTGTLTVHPVLDQAALQVVQGYTADLITGLTHDMSAKINASIQRAFLGQANLDQLVAQIGGALEGGKFSGLFSQVGERALSIATNEIMRVQSLASVARINALKEHHSGLKKQWKHIPVARLPRIGHLRADGQLRDPGEAFEVEGEALQYPRDPSGSAENTINCHCLVIPYIGSDDLKPTDQERGLLKSLGISVTANAD